MSNPIVHVCGAKTRRGTTCQRPPMPNGRCYLHGGKTPAGLASPQFKTGRYSKVLPARLAARYQEALTDTTLLELREEISLLDTRLADVLNRVESGESGEVWRLLRTTFTAFNRAKAAGKVPEMTSLLVEIEHLIVRGLADYAAWQDVSSLLEQRRKLVESERKRLVDMQQMMTSEQAMVMLAAVVDTVRRHVTDRNALAAISADITRLVAVGVRQTISE